MERRIHTRALRSLPSRRLAWLLIFSALGAFLLFSPVRAQEAPDATPGEGQETTIDAGDALIRMEVVATVEPVAKGDEFEVRVLVDNAEHLGGFDFIIEYDPDRVEPVEAGRDDATPGSGDAVGGTGTIRVEGEAGEFLANSPRGQNIICTGPFIRKTDKGIVSTSCVTLGLPFCLDGLEGATGSGLLGSVTFKSKGGDMTTLRLASSNLLSDDVAPPCDPELLTPQQIAHGQGDAVTVLLSGGGGTSTVLIGAIIGIIVALLGGGLAGFLWYQRRGAASQ